MIEFEVKSKTQTIGKKKGQTVYFAQAKTNKKTRALMKTARA